MLHRNVAPDSEERWVLDNTNGVLVCRVHDVGILAFMTDKIDCFERMAVTTRLGIRL